MHKTQPSMLTDEPLIGIDEASVVLRLKRSTVYAHTSNRTIPHYKRGGRLYFRRSELLAWLVEGRRPVINQGSVDGHNASVRGDV
jgi:excisionase family DNA binding protein